MGRFINPFTDFGFKFLFGREVEKELLIDFLNDLLVGEHVITDIQFLNSEQQPEVKTERGLIYDIYCVTDTGERIIVEMQNREQPYFKDRALFYLSRATVSYTHLRAHETRHDLVCRLLLEKKKKKKKEKLKKNTKHLVKKKTNARRNKYT